MEANETEVTPKRKMMNKYVLIMILCCLIPVAAIAVLRIMGIQNAFLSLAASLICPLSLAIMMAFMLLRKQKRVDEAK